MTAALGTMHQRSMPGMPAMFFLSVQGRRGCTAVVPFGDGCRCQAGAAPDSCAPSPILQFIKRPVGLRGIGRGRAQWAWQWGQGTARRAGGWAGRGNVSLRAAVLKRHPPTHPTLHTAVTCHVPSLYQVWMAVLRERPNCRGKPPCRVGGLFAARRRRGCPTRGRAQFCAVWPLRINVALLPCARAGRAAVLACGLLTLTSSLHSRMRAYQPGVDVPPITAFVGSTRRRAALPPHRRGDGAPGGVPRPHRAAL